jgi:peptidoglycan/xylan/chitin deacetylase (PgdA/CDA1 family)
MNRYALKRNLLSSSGLLAYAWAHLRGGIYVFNYHRIGDARTTDFDPNVFSSDELHFSQQIRVLKSRFRIIDVKGLLDIIDAGDSVRAPLAMITFDDGYRDNYDVAFPILQSMQVPAVFFVPSSYIGSDIVPWWDEVAWLIRRTEQRTLDVPWLQNQAVLSGDRGPFIRLVLTAFKRSELSIDAKLEQVRAATGCRIDLAARAGLFMTWDHVRQMRAAGMDIGSHTHSHRILGHLGPGEQEAELATAKAMIEKELGEPIHTLAFPVGGPGTYTSTTQALAKQCGYKAAFNFRPGVNDKPASQPFDLHRLAVEGNAGPDDIRLLASLAGTALGAVRPSKLVGAVRQVVQAIKNR